VAWALDQVRVTLAWASLPKGSGGPQASSRQKQVGQCEEREDLGAVLFNAAIADLAIAKLAFENAEYMLDLGADRAVSSVALELR
jgi:hypothetical protein